MFLSSKLNYSIYYNVINLILWWHSFLFNAVHSKTFYSLNLRTLLVFVAIKLFYLILSNLNNLFRAVAYLFPFLDVIKINT